MSDDTDLTQTAILDALDQVEDPEIPISLRDLGVLKDVEFAGDEVRVTLVPTRMACPGRDMMARGVERAVQAVDADRRVSIEWDLHSWHPNEITASGKGTLRGCGFATLDLDEVRCPYCDSDEIRREGGFGGSLCKTPFTCRACGSTFDALRSALPLASQSTAS